jgi:hypothetical protein
VCLVLVLLCGCVFSRATHDSVFEAGAYLKLEHKASVTRTNEPARRP